MEFVNVHKELHDFSATEKTPNNSIAGTYVATVPVLIYTGLLIYITHIYVKTRFENMEDSHRMKTIVGSSMAFSILILLILVVSTIPQTMQIWRLKRLH